MNSNTRARTYWDREAQCEEVFLRNGPFWMITAGRQPRSVFISHEDYSCAVNAAAVSAARSGVTIYIDVYMSNHAHWLVGGTEEASRDFFNRWRNHVAIYETHKGIKSDLRGWESHFAPAENLKALRNMTAYIARNGYLAMTDATPFGYEWTSADLFFNSHRKDLSTGEAYSSLSIEKKRKICRSRDVTLPAQYRARNGMIARETYIALPGLEALFNSGNQYFAMLSRNSEADINLSRLVGETITIPDDEMFSAVSLWCKRDLKVDGGIRELTQQQRLQLAMKMRSDYNSSNRQISQILRLARDVVDRLFPPPGSD